jgi:hypothetical protein
MKSDNIEQKLEQLADAIGCRDSFVSDVMNKIENSSMQSDTSGIKNVPTTLQLKNSIDQWMRVAAVFAVMGCGGLGVLVTFLVRTNTLASTMAFMTSCINSLSYVGGLLL